MNTNDTGTLISNLRTLGLFINDRQPGICVAMQQAADRLYQLQSLHDYIEQPEVLMSIPQPHRLKISELLHGEKP
jgi:hypothetical protein